MTASLLPGSLAVMNCSSLYFWNAGPRSFTMDGSATVRALMSALWRLGQSNAGTGRAVDCERLAGNDICKLQEVSSVDTSRQGIGRTSPGGASPTKEDTHSTLSDIGGELSRMGDSISVLVQGEK